MGQAEFLCGPRSSLLISGCWQNSVEVAGQSLSASKVTLFLKQFITLAVCFNASRRLSQSSGKDNALF